MAALSASESGSIVAAKPAAVAVVVVAAVEGVVAVGDVEGASVVAVTAVGGSRTGSARVPLPHAVTSTVDATSP
jgi:hypothetical protein